ncbi:MAG: ATP-binding cassette domain-containing protein [Saprospiraceae bacterium]|nr:ATP-binding cassette domain-containing protein [Lewinella sp.]
MITVKQLSKYYGNKLVLKAIDIEFMPGKVYGIVGENGAGKTTFFRCLAGLEDFEGQIISDRQPLRHHLGFLPTNPVFLSRITGWEYLKLLCIARDITADNFTEKNVFDLPLEQYATTYSTGMKKKLALLAILLQNNEVFVLDEPFNGVDIHSNMIISEIIRHLKAEGKTILISSHIFATLRENCDEIHLLREGRFAKRVTPPDFDQLDSEMRSFVVGDVWKRLGIKGEE